MSEFDWPPPIDRPAILADQAVEVIHDRASNWVRAWDSLLLQDDPKAYAMRIGPDQSALYIDMVCKLSHGCVETLRTAQDPSERGRESEGRYVERVRSKRPHLTPALRRIGRAILHARQMVMTIYPTYDGPGWGFAEGMDDSQEARRAAWTELRDAKAELGAALYAPPPAEPEPIETPAASSKLNDEPVPVKATAAAYALKLEGKPVSLRAVCERAGVDRVNLSKRHPEIIAIIDALAKPDRALKRGVRDRRTGDVDAWESDAED